MILIDLMIQLPWLNSITKLDFLMKFFYKSGVNQFDKLRKLQCKFTEDILNAQWPVVSIYKLLKYFNAFCF